jgi:hypothetical protein
MKYNNNACKIVVRKFEERISFGKPRHREENNIKI